MSALPFEWFWKKPPPGPAQLYQALLSERQEAYETLREATLSLVYLRQRLEAETFERRAEIARLHDQARRLARRGADEQALEKLLEKQTRRSELEAQEDRLFAVRKEGERAKARLDALGAELRALEAERLEVLATSKLSERLERLGALEARASQARTAAQKARPRLSSIALPESPRELDTDWTTAKLDLALLKAQAASDPSP